MVAQNPESLLCHMEYEDLLAQCLDVRHAADLVDSVQTWKQGVAQVRQLMSSLAKAAGNLKSHVENVRRKEERKLAAEQREKEQQAELAVKKQALAAAALVKEGEQKIPPLFAIELTKLHEVAPPMERCAGEIEHGKLDVDMPCLFEQVPAFGVWSRAPRVQMAPGNFGWQYRKAQGFKEEGRSQMQLHSREGKEETMELWSALKAGFPETAIVDPPDGNIVKRVLAVSWLYGYDQKMRSVTSAPTGLAMMKHLAHGTVAVVAFETCSLSEALQKELEHRQGPHGHGDRGAPEVRFGGLAEAQRPRLCDALCVP